MTSKLVTVHYKYAMALEDDGKFSEAEENFIKAGKPKEAILMYIHAREWEKAEHVAEMHDRDSLADVLVSQAKDAMDQGNYSVIESLLLRAQKPEILVKYYQDAEMWVDALRVCREYLPSKLPALQSLYDRQVGNEGMCFGLIVFPKKMKLKFLKYSHNYFMFVCTGLPAIHYSQ